MSALVDPQSFGLDMVIQERVLTLLKKGILTQRPLGTRVSPTWSLHKVLHYITFEEVDELSDLLQRTMFHLSLAKGVRSSQLAALTRYPNNTVIGQMGDSLTVTPSLKF